MKTGETAKAIEVVAINAIEDICVIRIDNTKFASLPLGDSSLIQTGDEIYVASNPKGLEGTFTKGIISSLRKDLGLFQLDAAISSGSSGGVLLNPKAEAVGIIKSSLVSGQNLNFAIPINRFKGLTHRFRHPVLLAGSCAYSSRVAARLNGMVSKITETYSYEPDVGAKPVIKTVTRFDLAGNKAEEINYEKDGSYWYKSALAFDESGLMISAVHSRDGEPDTKVIFPFEDSVKRKIEFRTFSNKLGAFTYNSAGEPVGLTAPFFSAKSKFDRFGRESERSYLNENGEIESVTRFRYIDDNYSNWIEMLEYNNYPSLNDQWELRRKSRREIEYYH